MIRAEQTMERHDSQIGKIFSKIDEQGESIQKINTNMLQIKWSVYGAIGFYIVTQIGIIEAFKVAV